ncbi:hypothetical protein Q5H92_14390 [Hymenobacter sp. M29]|uniref:EfeO-type cupredoxin-like domain-containing protein n=1 Tax=Hymenobacter mellowenesis TaxID=3063995 RepID=A0ABT9ACJ5_9BACT|nr:hypothetical protein [Hymenobacter sp. M29]MDO7847555.1 hypothetical protein [Hymenobacter sp. M29]
MITTVRFQFAMPLARRAVGALVALWLLGTGHSAHAQTWMVSTTAQIKLGILDKYGQLGPYTATFVVHNEKTGKDYFLVKQLVKNQTGIDVLFPTDPSDPDYFKTESGEAANATPGRYTWECRVKGVKAVSGRFVFPEVANDVTVIKKTE